MDIPRKRNEKKKWNLCPLLLRNIGEDPTCVKIINIMRYLSRPFILTGIKYDKLGFYGKKDEVEITWMSEIDLCSRIYTYRGEEKK